MSQAEVYFTFLALDRNSFLFLTTPLIAFVRVRLDHRYFTAVVFDVGIHLELKIR